VQSVNTLADRIDSFLPQTQCTRCGYADCRAYADAIAKDEVGIDRCPPGGDETINALAMLLQRDAKPLDPAVGTFAQGTVAVIEESLCIGCTKCIAACPMDAIVGGPKLMHTVVEALCTGCELCLPPCPVDCIRLASSQDVTEGYEGWQFPRSGSDRAAAMRARYLHHRERQEQRQGERRERRNAPVQNDLHAQRKAEIAAAVARVRAKRGRPAPGKH